MRLVINSSEVKYDTGKSSLIKLPKENKFFWLSNKCVYPNGYRTTIYVKSDYEYFGLVGKNRQQKEKFGGEEIIEAFEGTEPLVAHTPSVEHHKPEKKVPIHVEPDDELKR